MEAAKSNEKLALGSQLVAQRKRLEAASTRYEKWCAATTGTRETGAKARAELERRGLVRRSANQRQRESGSERQTMAAWWRQLEADLAAVGTALEREHQAVIAAGHSWPPQPECAPNAGLAIDREPRNQSARLNEMLSHATDAAGRLAADRADQEARAEYAARVERSSGRARAITTAQCPRPSGNRNVKQAVVGIAGENGLRRVMWVDLGVSA